MISLYRYHHNFKEADSLLDELKAPVFLKTELDVVYDDFVRWENNSLLWPHTDFKKNVQRRYSYVEYTWLKIVEQLRTYGFSHNVIKGYLLNLTQVVDNQAFINAYPEAKEKLTEAFGEEVAREFMENIKGPNPTGLVMISLLELLLINVISYNDIVSLLFYTDEPELCLPISGEVYKEIANQDDHEYIEYLNKSHVSISITEIAKKFVENDIDEKSKSERFKSILSKEEHNLLKIVRKKYKNIKSLKIRFESEEMKMIEVKTTKKTSVESRLLEHIKKGDYSNIQIETVNGQIVNFENTQKYKL